MDRSPRFGSISREKCHRSNWGIVMNSVFIYPRRSGSIKTVLMTLVCEAGKEGTNLKKKLLVESPVRQKNGLTFGQSRKEWKISSSWAWHLGQVAGMEIALVDKSLQTGTALCATLQRKNFTLWWHGLFKITFHNVLVAANCWRDSESARKES